MKLKCLIVDDEAPAHKVLQAHIAKTDILEIVGDVYNGKEALDFLSKTKVDLIFLDIEMPKLTGLELLQCLPYHVSVILTTAYSNFGFEAYQNDVVDYLLKPISFPRFLKAINKVTNLRLPTKKEEPKFPDIELKHEGVLKTINTKSIIYIEAVGNYIKINLINEKPLLVTQTMKYISSLLPQDYFTRIHKSFIVKREAIAEIKKTEITLINKVTLPVGRKYSVLLE
ncbi:LytR/AlgR family response regulator transcription factor [Aurantibacillus circumpalustris]|uniref:LytR/AlgR family response regulator transcription factor n=1 Tax=Aurantibacillus circumpalustris TaxID=3036359 RepID=UPI00295B37D2|nr:LytTR family DNA-binding domain-containing protein [Aurantibacillus circumpalustris]